VAHSPTQDGNNPFSSWPKLLFQSEAWCTTLHMKKSFSLHVNKISFSTKKLALRLVLRKKFRNGLLGKRILDNQPGHKSFKTDHLFLKASQLGFHQAEERSEAIIYNSINC